MSLKKTFPIWAPTAVATERGWTDPRTGEVYVSIRDLPNRLIEEEQKLARKNAPVIFEDSDAEIMDALNAQKSFDQVAEFAEVVESIKEVIVETEKEIVMEKEVAQEAIEVVKAKRPYNRKLKVDEVVEQDSTRQIIGEVVEYGADLKVIGE